MLSSIILALVAAKAISATPSPDPNELVRRVVDLSDPDLVLKMDSNGGEVVNHTRYREQLMFEGVLLERPETNHDYLNFTADATPLDLSHLPPSKRQACVDTYVTVVDAKQRFVDWDVQMCTVACGDGGPMDIWVQAGFSVANSIAVSIGLTPTLVKDYLGMSVGVSFETTYTTSASVQTKGTVDRGNCGTMITQPLVTRRYGRVMRGCIGAMRTLGTFMADDHGHGQYNGVPWIEGSVTMCAKPGSLPPLTLCRGKGVFK